MDSGLKKKALIILCVCFVLVLAVIYGWNDPETNALFPRCFFKKYTGLDCPGCGSQRAVHNLLHLNVGKAFMNNPLMVISIPYIIGGVWFDSRKQLTPLQLTWRRRLYGVKAIYFILVVITLFTVLRNLF